MKPMHVAIMLLLATPINTFAAGYKLPDTGQTKCYNTAGSEITCTGSGQDGAYTTSPMSFTDNGNGTVTDNNTGLVWQKCSVGQNNNDAWCSGTATLVSWYPTSCSTLTLAGGGWRLPTKKELMSIVDYSIPYQGASISEAFPNTVTSGYWTSTTYSLSTSIPNAAWVVHFSDGSSGMANLGMAASAYVRCVR